MAESNGWSVHLVPSSELYSADALALDPSDRWMMIVLGEIARSKSYCFPSNEFLIDSTGLADVRSIQRCLGRLESSGWIERIIGTIRNREERVAILLRRRLDLGPIANDVAFLDEAMQSRIETINRPGFQLAWNSKRDLPSLDASRDRVVSGTALTPPLARRERQIRTASKAKRDGVEGANGTASTPSECIPELNEPQANETKEELRGNAGPLEATPLPAPEQKRTKYPVLPKPPISFEWPNSREAYNLLTPKQRAEYEDAKLWMATKRANEVFPPDRPVLDFDAPVDDASRARMTPEQVLRWKARNAWDIGDVDGYLKATK